jgi:hypothetical protein
MAASSDELRKRYASLSDSELVELHKAGGLTEEASNELKKLLSERGIEGSKIEEIVSDQSNQQRQEYLSSAPKPIPKVWIGFVIAAVGLLAEFFDGAAGFEGRFGTATLFFICGTVYWLFCLHRLHDILKHVSFGTYPISPAAAVGFHFIPFYNLYWVFKWPMEFVRFLKQNQNVVAIPGWLMGLSLLFSMLVARILDGAIGQALIFCLLLYLASKLRQHVISWNVSSQTTAQQGVPPDRRGKTLASR